MDKGARRFAFVLVDNWFRISIPSSAESSLPMAYVQVSSEVLTLAGPKAVMKNLNFVINSLGFVMDKPQISRVDLCVDFSSAQNMNEWENENWVTRARNISKHYDGKEFSGWSIGVGGSIGARLYNKVLEIKKSKKTYLFPIWESAGWKLGHPVWRLEFEFKREVLTELGVLNFDNLMESLAAMWNYATTDWLRLTIPNQTDKTQSRWPCHSLWKILQSLVCWHGDKEYVPIERVRKQRIPRSESLFINGLAPITSFMAREGFTDFDEGLGEFLHQLVKYHKILDKSTLYPLEKYVKRKVAEKARKYNTIDQRERTSKEEIKARAKAYRKARDGE